MQQELDQELINLQTHKKVWFGSQVKIHYIEDDEKFVEFIQKTIKHGTFAAVYRIRFKERIKNFDDKYGYILNVSHRNFIKCYLNKCSIL